MKNLIIVLLLMVTFFTCEKDTNNIDLQELETEKISQGQSGNSELQSLDREKVQIDNDNRAPKYSICGGLVIYPSGNTPPCLVRHKMTYLDEEYDEVNEPDNTVFFILETVHEASGSIICSVRLGENDGLGLVSLECILPVPGIYIMSIYRYVISSSGGVSSRRICARAYCAGAYICDE